MTGCKPGSLDEFRRAGRQSARSLSKELSAVQSRQDLITAGPRIKKKFDEMVDLIIAAREFYERHPEKGMIPLDEDDREASDSLKKEIERVMRLQGGETLLAEYREEALDRLHRFELQVEKRKLKRR